jgi:hypothetical protein
VSGVSGSEREKCEMHTHTHTHTRTLHTCDSISLNWSLAASLMAFSGVTPTKLGMMPRYRPPVCVQERETESEFVCARERERECV